MKRLIISLIFLVLISYCYAGKVYPSTYIVSGDYCIQGGNCTLDSLNVTNLNTVNTNITNLQILGDINNSDGGYNMETNNMNIEGDLCVDADCQGYWSDADAWGLNLLYTPWIVNNVMVGFQWLPDGNIWVNNTHSFHNIYALGDAIIDGNVSGENLYSSDDAQIEDNLIVGGDITATGIYASYYDWIVGDDWAEFDGKTWTFNESMLATVYYGVSQYAVIAGTVEGNIGNITHNDGNYDSVTLNVTEQTGSPALDIRMNFSGVDDFNAGVMRYYTSALSGGTSIIQLWEYGEEKWEDYPQVVEHLTFATIEQSVFDSSEHIQDGIVQMRIYDSTNGNINHKYYIDWIAISKGYGTPAGEEVDPEFIMWYNNSNPILENITIQDTGRFVGGVTAGGNVSAENLYSSDDAQIEDDLLVGGDLTTTGTGSFGDITLPTEGLVKIKTTSGGTATGLIVWSDTYAPTYYGLMMKDASFEGILTNANGDFASYSDIYFNYDSTGDTYMNYGGGNIYNYGALEVGYAKNAVHPLTLWGMTSGNPTLKRGGSIIWDYGSTSQRYMFMNSNNQLVFDTTAQASTTDTGNAWIDFDDGSASFQSITANTAPLTINGGKYGIDYYQAPANPPTYQNYYFYNSSDGYITLHVKGITYHTPTTDRNTDTIYDTIPSKIDILKDGKIDLTTAFNGDLRTETFDENQNKTVIGMSAEQTDLNILAALSVMKEKITTLESETEREKQCAKNSRDFNEYKICVAGLTI